MGGGWQLKRKRRRWWGKGGTELELNRAMEHSARETKKEQEPTRGRISGGRVKGTVNVPYFKRASGTTGLINIFHRSLQE